MVGFNTDFVHGTGSSDSNSHSASERYEGRNGKTVRRRRDKTKVTGSDSGLLPPRHRFARPEASKFLPIQHVNNTASSLPTFNSVLARMGSTGEPSFSAPPETVSVHGLLFDFDGTIIDSTPAVEKYWHKCVP